MSWFTQFCLTVWVGGCIATPGSPHIPEGLLAREEGCATHGVLQRPPFCAGLESPWGDTHEQLSAPKDADASPRGWLCALPESLSPLPPPCPHLLLSACFLHTGILRRAWGAKGFTSPTCLPRAEAVGLAVGAVAWAPGASGALRGGKGWPRGPRTPPAPPPWQPWGL